MDIHCVFPNFNADPDDPASYDFALTDEYIAAIEAAGAKVFYRLGESIEHSAKKYYIHPPADNKQWARICEGIIRHYNEGWADGHHYNIQYWEIWNEPDNLTPVMWTGTPLQFFQLYETTANHLKSKFPDIKIGGYAGCGFPPLHEKNKHWYDFFEDFLKYISSPEHRAPLDFFSWHRYSDNPDIVLASAAHARERLNAYGFTKTESIFNEWNYTSKAVRMRSIEAAAYAANLMTRLQRETDIALAAYYDASFSKYCGLFVPFTNEVYKPYYAFKAFGVLYGLGTEAAIAGDPQGVHALAATDGKEGAVLLSNFSEEPKTIKVRLSGLPKGMTATVNLLDAEHDFDAVQTETFDTDEPTLTVTLNRYAFALVTLRKQKNP